MQNENSKNWFEHLSEKLANEPKPSEDEIALRQTQRNEASEALEGTSKESAFMKDDRSIALKYWTFKDGVIGDGWDVVQPGDSHYQEICAKHKLKNPGDAGTITLRWINNQWMPEEKPNNAKTA